MASKFSKRMIEDLQSNNIILIPDLTEVKDLSIKAMVDLFYLYAAKRKSGFKSSSIYFTTWAQLFKTNDVVS